MRNTSVFITNLDKNNYRKDKVKVKRNNFSENVFTFPNQDINLSDLDRKVNVELELKQI